MNYWEEKDKGVEIDYRSIKSNDYCMGADIANAAFAEAAHEECENEDYFIPSRAEDDGVNYQNTALRGVLVFKVDVGTMSRDASFKYIDNWKQRTNKLDGVEMIWLPVRNQGSTVEFLSFEADASLKQALEEKTLELEKMTKAYETVHRKLMDKEFDDMPADIMGYDL